MKENEIDYSKIKEINFYYCKNKLNAHNLKGWLDDVSIPHYLYRMKNVWTLTIDDKIIDLIKNEINICSEKYEISEDRDGRLYIFIAKLKKILDNLLPLDLNNVELDEFNLIKRNSKVTYHDVTELKSDITNTGYKSIYFGLDGGYKLSLNLVINNTIYDKNIRVGKRNTLKHAIYTLLSIKCSILGIECPAEESLDVSRLYRYANKIGYTNEEHKIKDKKIPLTYSKFNKLQIKPSVASSEIEKTTNCVGYKNINLKADEDKVYLMFTINKKNCKIMKRKRIYTVNDYKDTLKEYIKMYCEIYKVNMPEKINYDLGLNAIKKSGIEIIVS